MVELKSDRFRKVRGGYSRLLDILCEKCGTHVALYQKDGPGPLKRMYADRILEPAIKTNSNLTCKKCGEVLGVPFIYKKEKRPAFRLFAGAVRKQIRKSNAGKS